MGENSPPRILMISANKLERKNRTIVEAVKAMIHDQNLPMSLWAEATSTAVYVHNRSPHQILEDKTREEAFLGMNPKFSHLIFFGYLVYIHVPLKDKRIKIESFGNKAIFVGYSEILKA